MSDNLRTTGWLGDALYADRLRWGLRVIKAERAEVDATWFEDKWSHSSGHYTSDGGGVVEYSYPSKVVLTVTVSLPKDVAEEGVDEEGVKVAARELDARFFTDLISETSAIEKLLQDEVEADDGDVDHVWWRVSHATVEAALVKSQVQVEAALDLVVVEAEAEHESDRRGRRGSLRDQVIRLAYARPDLRTILVSTIRVSSAMDELHQRLSSSAQGGVPVQDVQRLGNALLNAAAAELDGFESFLSGRFSAGLSLGEADITISPAPGFEEDGDRTERFVYHREPSLTFTFHLPHLDVARRALRAARVDADERRVALAWARCFDGLGPMQRVLVDRLQGAFQANSREWFAELQDRVGDGEVLFKVPEGVRDLDVDWDMQLDEEDTKLGGLVDLYPKALTVWGSVTGKVRVTRVVAVEDAHYWEKYNMAGRRSPLER